MDEPCTQAPRMILNWKHDCVQRFAGCLTVVQIIRPVSFERERQRLPMFKLGESVDEQSLSPAIERRLFFTGEYQ